MCKKHTSVSHSSIKGEVISLDEGSRMDGIPALGLWELSDWSISFLTEPNQLNQRCKRTTGNLSATPQSNIRRQIPTTNTNLDLINFDHVPSSGTHSGFNGMLYVFDDNEAVIKMNIKGRSPTMRHVSRTHRVALGLILILKISFDAFIPNIISKTFWPMVISHVSNGTIFFICSTSAISALSGAPRIPAW